MKHPVLANKSQYEDHPITIFDHQNKILAADVLRQDTRLGDPLLASLDLDGLIHIRSLKRFDESYVEHVVYTVKLSGAMAS